MRALNSKREALCEAVLRLIPRPVAFCPRKSAGIGQPLRNHGRRVICRRPQRASGLRKTAWQLDNRAFLRNFLLIQAVHNAGVLLEQAFVSVLRFGVRRWNRSKNMSEYAK
jgi:hypothetical protein